MKKIVLNIPYAQIDNDLSDVLFKPNSGVLSEMNMSIVMGDMAKVIEETSQPDTLLINGITFASDNPEAIDATGKTFDVCIAFNDDDSRPNEQNVSTVWRRLKNFGSYNFGVNPPFIKNIVGAPKCPSLTIALNRRLYLNEDDRTMRSPAYKWNILLYEIYSVLLQWNSFTPYKQQMAESAEILKNTKKDKNNWTFFGPSTFEEFIYELTGDEDVYVSSAIPLPDKRLLCNLNKGSYLVLFDFKPLLDKKGFVGLKDDDIFYKVDCSNGVPNWDNERIDIAPEYIYEHGKHLSDMEYEQLRSTPIRRKRE